MENKKEIITWVCISLLTFTIMYLMIAFINLNINASMWDKIWTNYILVGNKFYGISSNNG